MTSTSLARWPKTKCNNVQVVRHSGNCTLGKRTHFKQFGLIFWYNSVQSSYRGIFIAARSITAFIISPSTRIAMATNERRGLPASASPSPYPHCCPAQPHAWIGVFRDESAAYFVSTALPLLARELLQVRREGFGSDRTAPAGRGKGLLGLFIYSCLYFNFWRPQLPAYPLLFAPRRQSAAIRRQSMTAAVTSPARVQ